MMRVRTKLPGFCKSKTVVRVGARSSSQPYKKNGLIKFDKTDNKNNIEMSFNSVDSRQDFESTGNNNRVMVVVDPSLDANCALQWALSHTVQSQDTIILLYVSKISNEGEKANSEFNQKAYELLCSMKNMCQTRKPGVQVEIAIQEGKEKGAVIVEEAKQRNVSLLVLGQRKRSIMWRLLRIWTRKRSRSRVVKYCIQKANCMTVAVRRKSSKSGGYLITTKRHKKFWLLA
ncbi:uncharacterized protein LOC107783093 [Nicotiana tabacum]|uniref:Uncharacterized protein LOC107783093 n=1 Tax=Nicotiana tabacum TaxID=4097 RepID=A0A1S3Z5R1_TOBAC|nr:uncharacterized protein LOC104121383 isoform X2 [Nicotiana tomentosiformis]XP_016459547.1 PREDICTED: uncharacterized protein LOC107783093 [Nicotiana tabacum]